MSHVGSVPVETPATKSPLEVVPRPFSSGANTAAVNITIDQGTNTLLIAATSQTHQRLEKLIKQLNQKQPQVLLEPTMVSVADSDTFNAAVDVAVRGHFAGSTVGIGTNNSGIGTGTFTDGRTPTVVSGLNAAIFNPASFSVFMSAWTEQAAGSQCGFRPLPSITSPPSYRAHRNNLTPA